MPDHWCSVPIKYMALERSSLFLDGDWIESKDISSDGIRYITTGNVGEGAYKEQGAGFISEETFHSLRCTEVYEGDVLVSRLNNPIGRACVVPDLGGKVVTSVDNVIFRPDSKFYRKFIVYLFSSEEYFKHTSNLARGATMQRISRGLLGNIRVVTPSREEQTQIARFLDHETAKIDALIREQERLIELLQEKRQAVISHAVTKGLDPDVPMKDSGVEWLGEVPAHWEMVPLKYLCSFSGGGTPSKENLEYWNGDIPWVSPKDMKSFWISNSIDKITELAVAESSTSLVEPNALLMVVRSGILQRTIPVAVNTVEVTLNQDMKALRFSMEGFERYFAMLVQGFEPSWLLEWRKQGATVESIEQEYLAESLIPVPPRNEIYAIVNKVAAVAKRYESLEEEAHNSSQLLRERRSALISAAVTGKIDVRNWQPPADESAFDKEVRQAGMEATA
ncbi:MAG: restriction endonuclease subunit S [Marinobacter sp.]|uniref:restriction endonuclease subunit S n=1 Tax=Marinobacter sp. TaxID=50741 RepID=UPI001B515C20|nr:restriction endonuclease subunit S [Marinobacter sp.]MBQ0812723.1 restriction endonuclease subunit S [Marinobacter sp.]